MSESSQARTGRRDPEIEISVDLSESDSSKSVQRRAKPQASSDIAEGVRDTEGTGRGGKTPAERELFKRMTRFQRNMTKQFDQKFAEQEARHQQEIAKLRERGGGVSVEGGDAEAMKSAHEAAMAKLEEELAAANEKGDSVLAAKITTKMIMADGAYHAKLAGATQRKDTGGGQDPNARQTQARPAATGPTPAGSRFILANEDWWEDPDYAIEKAAASQIYIDLVNNEGFNNNSDETFKEVAKRLKDKFKDLPVVAGKRRGDEDDPDADLDPDRPADDGDRQQRRERGPAANMQDRGANNDRRNSGNRVTLTPADMKTMRSVGMSPDNDRDVVQFLREKQATEAAGA
jgi:hypothetical protein